jgi:tRNA threonylcarbamoyladenosine biosynthesis protein TsaE
LQTLVIRSAGPGETLALGEFFGQSVEKGLVVLLNGNLGAGKTCFAQGVGNGVGVSPSTPVTSPSYTLLNIHQGRIPLYHFDLYRLNRVDDLADLGYDDYAEGNGLTLVEWADRMSAPLQEAISLSIERLGNDLRQLNFVASNANGERVLQRFSSLLGNRDKPA